MITAWRRFIADRNHWLVLAYIAFAFLIGIYACLYYAAYLSDRTNFFFASDVAIRQSASCRDEALTRLAILARATAAIDEADSVVRSDHNLTVKARRTTIPTSRGLTVIVDRRYLARAYWADVSVTDSVQRTLDSWGSGPLPVEYEVKDALAQYSTSLAQETRSLTVRLATVGSATPDVWSFWDFLYFSVITQGTVGYGDILPNSSWVRWLVITQVLFSYVLVLVVLNWVVLPYRRRIDGA